MSVLRLLRFAALGLSALCCGAMAQAPAAGSWPNKPIRWIVPYTPGGITDNATRMVLQQVQQQTGWNIVVDNKPGANSLLGADLAAKAPPDGYTFLTVIAAHAANATLPGACPSIPSRASHRFRWWASRRCSSPSPTASRPRT
jgi:tripartite-type tricarboxylate transporter receptor subunit TctC